MPVGCGRYDRRDEYERGPPPPRYDERRYEGREGGYRSRSSGREYR